MTQQNWLKICQRGQDWRCFHIILTQCYLRTLEIFPILYSAQRKKRIWWHSAWMMTDWLTEMWRMVIESVEKIPPLYCFTFSEGKNSRRMHIGLVQTIGIWYAETLIKRLQCIQTVVGRQANRQVWFTFGNQHCGNFAHQPRQLYIYYTSKRQNNLGKASAEKKHF